MNRERRAILNGILNQLSKCRTVGNISMKELDDICNSLTSVSEDELESYQSLPDNLMMSDRAFNMLDNVGDINEAVSLLTSIAEEVMTMRKLKIRLKKAMDSINKVIVR